MTRAFRSSERRLGRLLSRAAWLFAICTACSKILGADGNYVEQPTGTGGSAGARGDATGEDGGSGAATTGGSAGADADAGSDADASDALGLCDSYAREVCQANQTCCTQTGIGFSESGCESVARSVCETMQAKAAAGQIVIDQSQFQKCIDAFKAQPCEFSAVHAFLASVEIKACLLRFQPTAQTGDAGRLGDKCDAETPCLQESNPDVAVSCVQGTCVRIERLVNGAPCPVKLRIDATHYKVCPEGYFCEPLGDAASSTCQKAGSLGQSCAGPGTCADPYRCVSFKCENGLSPGSACLSADVCASKLCVPGADGGTVCGPFSSLESATACLGQQ